MDTGKVTRRCNSIIATVFAIILSSTHGAEKKQLNVVDYFLLLPHDYFEGSPQNWLDFLQQPKCGVVDLPNGYISCIGDGAQPEFEVALFRYRDPAGTGLLAVCRGALEGPNSVYLDFFKLGADGKMRKTRRTIFPVGDAGNGAGDWRFELPRAGKTVLVRNQKSGEVMGQFTWNGKKFVKEE